FKNLVFWGSDVRENPIGAHERGVDEVARMKKVGKYAVGRTIGQGTFAKVKSAVNTETGESVAMKMLAKNTILEHKMVHQVLHYLQLYFYPIIVLSSFRSSSLAMTHYIKREISIMKIVRHPNIVRLHEVHLRKLSENESRWYFQQLIDAVDYCHSKGVYHRDLKTDTRTVCYRPVPSIGAISVPLPPDWCYFHSVTARNRSVTADFDRCRSLSGGISRGRRKKREKKRENLEIQCRSPSVNPIRRLWGEEASARLLGENKLRRLREEENDVSSLYEGRRNEGARP
ncbi:hypothetical protein B296_00028992, partial [Ensete ventricosum]